MVRGDLEEERGGEETDGGIVAGSEGRVGAGWDCVTKVYGQSYEESPSGYVERVVK